MTRNQALFTAENMPVLTEILSEAGRRFSASELTRLHRGFAELSTGASPELPVHPLQRPALRFPGLSARPWYDSRDFLDAVGPLEAAWEEIRDELRETLGYNEGFQPYRQEGGNFFSGSDWQAMYLTVGETRFEENRRLCPTTASVVDGLPRLAEMVMFSALNPGAQIRPHCGPNNCRITLHLPIVVPDGCEIRVGDETRSWTPGKCLAFDDSFEHEVHNRGHNTRFVLLVDVWHPELSDAEIWVLKQIRHRLVGEQRVREIARIRSDRENKRGLHWWV